MLFCAVLIFRYATAAIILAYACWLIDNFACSPLVAHLYMHGWWHILLALGFYYCIVLISYLVADSYNYRPVATFWPNENLFILATVKWVDQLKSEQLLTMVSARLLTMSVLIVTNLLHNIIIVTSFCCCVLSLKGNLFQ